MAQNLKRMIERMQREECSKWEIVKAVAAEVCKKVWDFFVKCAQGLSYFFFAILIVVIEILILLVSIFGVMPVQIVILITAPLWYPMVSNSTKVELITEDCYDFDYEKYPSPALGLRIINGLKKFWFCTLWGQIAQAVYNRDWYPMEKRRHFIKADFKKRPLNSYPTNIQKEYFLMAEDKTLMAGKLSIEAANELFKDEGWGVRNILLKKCELTADWLEYVLGEDDLSFSFLKNYVRSEDCKKLSEEVLYELIKRLRGEYDEVMVIAYEQNAHTISKAQKAFEILHAYNSTHDLPEKIMFVLIKLAPKVAKAKEILLSQAERKNLSVGLIKEVYATQNEDLISEVKRITQAHADYAFLRACIEAGEQSDSSKKMALYDWHNYCKVREHVSVKAQVAMPYEFYKEYVNGGYKLDVAALETLLMDLKEDQTEYVKVLIQDHLDLISKEFELKLSTVKWKYVLYMKVKLTAP